ncbi:hypothetical protein LTR08_000906 [Meristemomyces frigidus]|nr:hypothetical protein LTR08_000906 [Meristemomyces frigidus]
MPSFDWLACNEAPATVPEWRKPIGTKNHNNAEKFSTEEKQALGRLAVLPMELLDHVLSYLHTKADLANVCASSTKLFLITTPILYNSVHFVINTEFQPKLKKMLTRENPGLDYIRDIKLSADFQVTDGGAAYEWIEIFVNAIPKDILMRFSWDTPRALPARITRLLWSRQRNLQHAEIFSSHLTGDNRGPDLVDYLDTHAMPAVKEMRLVPDNDDTALIGCAALKAWQITSLTVNACLWAMPDAHNSDVPGEIFDPLTTCLFNHLTPAPAGMPGTSDMLTSLTLSDINLRHAKQTWFRYLNLSKLKSLRLEHCANADIFLNCLANGGRTPHLQSLKIVHDLGERSDRTIDFLEHVLMFPSRTLQTLHLCFRNALRLPDLASLRCHANTLQELMLDITNPRPVNVLCYRERDLHTLLPECYTLKQLGLHLPSASFEYKSFAQSSTGFTRCLDIIIRNTCNLRSLAIFNWPDDYQLCGSPAYYATKVPQLARLAADIFARYRHYNPEDYAFGKDDLGAMLEIVAFGVRERDSHVPSPRYFVPAKVVSHRRERHTAEKKKISELVDEGLQVDMIDYEARDWNKQTRTSFQRYREYQDDDYGDEEDYEHWQ